MGENQEIFPLDLLPGQKIRISSNCLNGNVNTYMRFEFQATGNVGNNQGIFSYRVIRNLATYTDSYIEVDPNQDITSVVMNLNKTNGDINYIERQFRTGTSRVRIDNRSDVEIFGNLYIGVVPDANIIVDRDSCNQHCCSCGSSCCNKGEIEIYPRYEKGVRGIVMKARV